MASVLPRPLSWVAPPHVRLPGPRRDLCPSPRDRTRPSVSWAGSRSFRVPTSPRHPGLRPRQRRPLPAKGRGSCPRLDARSCRASGLSPPREPSPLPRSQRRALTVTFPTGSSTHPQASPGPGSPTSPGGTRGAPRATALWDRRWLPGNPGPPQPFQTPLNVHVAPLPATPQEQSVALRSPTKAPGLCPGPGRSTLACTPRGPQHPRASSTPGDPRRAGPPLRSGRPRATSVRSDGSRRPHSTRLPRRSVRLSYLAPRGRPGSVAAAPRRPPRPAAECGGNLCLVQPASATQPRNSR